MLKQAVILAGGLGTRLGEVARQTPKPLLDVGGRPLLEHIVWNLRRHGIDDIVMSVGHLAHRIEDHFGDGSAFGVRVRYVVEASPAGTGGALRLCADLLEPRFVLLNGDTLFDFNLLDLNLLCESSRAVACLALRPVPDASRFGGVETHGTCVVRFAEKTTQGPGVVNGGATIFDRRVLDRVPEGRSSLEHDVMPGLVAAGEVHGKAYDGFFLDIGLHETLQQAQAAVPHWRRKPALLLDRDGVLNIDHGYVHRPEQFEWIGGAIAAIKQANDAGALVIVVTNQAGIARGYYDDAQFNALMHWVNDRLAEHGAHLDAWYYCPHHPTQGDTELTRHCDCRKPAPGLILRALREWECDPNATVMIGDKPGDLAAARAAGVRGRLFEPSRDDLGSLVGDELVTLLEAHRAGFTTIALAPANSGSTEE